jgi:hypothetical protein
MNKVILQLVSLLNVRQVVRPQYLVNFDRNHDNFVNAMLMSPIFS